MRFFCETFLLRSPCLNFFWLVYIIFRTPAQSPWSHLPLTHHAWTRLLFSIPLMQPTWHFRWENTCVLFTLGNKWTSCYATHETHAPFPQGHRPVYPMKQVYDPVMLPSDFILHVKDIFLLLSNTWSLNGTLTGTTTSGQIRSGINDNKGVLHVIDISRTVAPASGAV